MASKSFLLLLLLQFISFLPLTVFPHYTHYSLIHLDTAVGSKLGDRVPAIAAVKSYLRRYGYMPADDLINDTGDDRFDASLESALKTYQSNFKLTPTGELDSATAAIMKSPRCGVPDIVNGTNWMFNSPLPPPGKKSRRRFRTTTRYNFFPGNPRWPEDKRNLTYGFLAGTPEMAKKPVARAFEKWESHFRSRFSFAGTEDYGSADIKIGFYSGYHGDAGSFDGPGGALAHSSQPGPGLLHFDAEETWAVGPVKKAFDVETVALHEIGHILGLMHSSVPSAIMYPAVGDGVTKELSRDDLHGIRALYHLGT
ncbi:Metalloendoproteinase 5-MMP [Linum grandiflorum]